MPVSFEPLPADHIIRLDFDLPPKWMLSLPRGLALLTGPGLVALERKCAADLGVKMDDILGLDQSPFYDSEADAVAVGRAMISARPDLVLFTVTGQPDNLVHKLISAA